MRPYLSEVAPTFLAALDLASDTSVALQHAEALAASAHAVLNNQSSVHEWLQHVPASLSAIAFGPHKDLIRLVLRVLAHAAGNDAANSEAVSCMLVLLQHPVPAVPQNTWAALQRLLCHDDAGEDVASLEGLQRLLSNEAVMRHVAMHGIASRSAETAAAAADILAALLSCRVGKIVDGAPALHKFHLVFGGDMLSCLAAWQCSLDCCMPGFTVAVVSSQPSKHAGVMLWQPWLDCYHGNAALGTACARADCRLSDAVNSCSGHSAAGVMSWRLCRVLLQRLYSKIGRVRHSAAKLLVEQVAGGAGLLEDTAIEGVSLLHLSPRPAHVHCG